MSMKDWAKNEIKLAMKREGDCDYGKACYKSAYKAYQSLLKDGHSGFSIKTTTSILNRLIDGKPLTAIEDTDDIWNFVTQKDDKTTYQSKRMSSLFKYVYSNGDVKYKDLDRTLCIDINTNAVYSSSFSSNIVDDLYPITMPYYPKNNSFKLYREDFLYDPTKGDFDHMGVFYLITPEGEKVEVNKFYQEMDDKGFVEISKEDYEDHKANKLGV